MTDDLTTRLAKAIHEYEFEGESRACGGDVMFRPLAAAVLAHLASEGDLVPEGGMALTAEQVEDVRTALGLNGPNSLEQHHAGIRIRGLFPAGKRAETLDGHCDSCGTSLACCEAFGCCAEVRAAKVRTPAPAVPAEEETKAEETLREKVADLESQLEEEIANRDGWEQRLTSLIYSLATVNEVGEWTSSDDLDEKFIDHIGGKIQQLERALLATRGEGWYEGYEVGLEYGPIAASGEEYDGPINPYDVPASSPVVPAPTETGPRYCPACKLNVPNAPYCTNCGGDTLADTGPWETWEAVPEGVKFESRDHAGNVWIKTSGRLHFADAPVIDLNPLELSSVAPFVAVTETGQWETLDEVPVGAAFRPRDHEGRNYFKRMEHAVQLVIVGNDTSLFGAVPVEGFAPFVSAEEKDA